jgi:ribosome-binding protein aMBF1 (putative translation factor)
MNAEKRKKLAAAGWDTTTVQEFLNLDKVDMELIETKLALTKVVREQRIRKHITQSTLAERMKTSQSRVAKIEAGDPTVSLDLIFRALFTMGVSRKALAAVV